MAAGVNWEKGLSNVREQIGDLRGPRRGHVDIAVIDAPADGHVPRLIRRMDRFARCRRVA